MGLIYEEAIFSSLNMSDIYKVIICEIASNFLAIV